MLRQEVRKNVSENIKRGQENQGSDFDKCYTDSSSIKLGDFALFRNRTQFIISTEKSRNKN